MKAHREINNGQRPPTLSSRKPGRWLFLRLCGYLAALSLILTACQGRKAATEINSRKELAAVTQAYRPGDAKPTLPALTTNSPLGDFLAYAMLNQPRVEAAYYDWVSAVERITVERSRPDPRLTFKSDISDTLLSLMPGLMLDLPGPGKLKARADLASAESKAKYYAFETAVLQVAAEVKKSYYQLAFLEDKIRVARETLKLLTDLEGLARSQNEFGKATMQDVLRAQIEVEKTRVLIASLADSRRPLLAQWNAALGLPPGAGGAPLPARFETTPLDLGSDQLLAAALARNPRLKAMEAEVLRAEAAITVARKGKVPDFNAGLEADAYAWPTVITPQAGVTLPIWKDKLAADIAAQQAQRRAASARLSSEQIQVAVELADQLFNYREATRNLDLLQRLLVPKAQMSLEVARENYLANRIDYFNLSDAQKTLLEFRMSEIDARVQRELSLAAISLLILGQPPAGTPVLPAQ